MTRTGGNRAGVEDAAQRAPLMALPDYRRLWTVGAIIGVVRWLETLAVALFVLAETGSAFLVTMMTLLRLLPMGLFGAHLGALADRVERRTCLAVIVGIGGLGSAGLGLLAWGGVLQVWQIGVVCFLSGFSWAADNPVRRMMLGQVVGTERMGRAMSIDVGTNNASRMVGPSIGGLVFATIGIAGAFGLSALLQAIAFAATLRIRARSGITAAPHGEGMLARISEGFALARRDPRLRGTLWVTIVFNVWGWPFTALVPVLARQQLGLGAEATGLLSSMDGAGAFLGAMILGVIARPAQYARWYIAGVTTYLVLLILFALAPTPALAGLALLVNGAGQAGFAVMQATLVYLAAPPEMRSRVLGLLTVCIGLGPIGFLHVGVLAELFGARIACIITGLEGLLALALTWRVWRPILEETPRR
ncbi:MAG: MFS transporter [Acetobacteraceae bacterium]|nr:MFS transporter [Acetobacteraceae bacterium]